MSFETAARPRAAFSSSRMMSGFFSSAMARHSFPLVARIIRRMVTPHDKEMQRLLERAVGLLEENNRLLNQRMTGRQPEEKQEATTPAG